MNSEKNEPKRPRKFGEEVVMEISSGGMIERINMAEPAREIMVPVDGIWNFLLSMAALRIAWVSSF